METKYYVYEWFIVETGEIFYVGKGTGKRYKVKSDRNKSFINTINSYECDVRIIKWFEEEQDAFEYERDRIQHLKFIGQCKCNIHSGGAGGSGEYWSDELRKEYSENNVMKRPEQRDRMSKNNPMKNQSICEKVNSQKRIGVIIGDNYYESLKAATQATGHYIDTIKDWCRIGHTDNGDPCYYSDVDHIPKPSKKFIPFTYKNMHYENFNDFYNDTKIPYSTLKNWLRFGFDSNGNICRRDNDTRKLRYLPKDTRPRSIVVNGVYYSSISKASKELGLRKGYLSEIIRGSINDPNYICIYDDQQPSQDNANINILEGSKTNE